ncbi:hypothetical protein EVAR_57334_1 [Eumeta japonica]|uniref:Uncharacterized protein n=1 Tax=Eumeta variegata TaxID=151549 RepID=A0A4C1ZZA3_EUMVA|nr:hypothetical protein EVAR_57334_1 [Eumeta japonica]
MSRSLRTQNRHLSEGLGGTRSGPVYATGDGRAMTLSATVLEVSPELYHLIKAGFVYVGLQRRPYGTSPRWCSVRAVSDTDTASVLQRSVREVRALRRNTGVTCRAERWRAPKMRKLHKGRLREPHMGHSARSAGSEQNGMIWLGRRWRTASSRRPGCRRPHTYGRGSSTEGCTDRVSLRFMQSNLQRSKLATTELLVEAARRNCGSHCSGTLYWEYWRAETVPGCRVVKRRLRGGDPSKPP